jgi:hypothetical protein
MHLTLVVLASIFVAAETGEVGKNPVFVDLLEKGITMSDGAAVKLPPPIMPDGLDGEGQRKAFAATAAQTPSSVEDLMRKSHYAPTVAKVRTLKASQNNGPAIRAIDVWFVVHGRWDLLTSKAFLETLARTKDDGPNRVMIKAGLLDKEELAARKLSITVRNGYEERFPYATFRLYDRVEISATRFSVLTQDAQSLVAAARIDPRFVKDADYPNVWRPLERNAQADITPGAAKPLNYGGGYAKVTRLLDQPGAVLIEYHMVYEEDYAWFDGVNLVKQKLPIMVQEKVRIFRRKLAAASMEQPSPE